MSGGRVVVLDHTGQLGGAEIALQRLLLAVDDAWDVSVLLFGDGPFRKSLEQAGINVEVLEMPERTARQSRRTLTDPKVLLRSTVDSFGFARSLTRRVKEMGAELVVANSLKAAVLAEVSSWRSTLPWVWHLHDRIAPDYLPGPVVFALRWLARRATHVVANSHDVARLTGLPPSRVSVAYPGLPDDAFTDDHTPPAAPVFGLLGRVSSTKGQREFIQAAAIVSRTHPDVRFRIVGEALFSDQPYAAEVKRLAEDLGVAERVEWTGWAADPRRAIDGFTALVHASPVPEPFGQVIVEAMARRVPVIATAGGGVGEILRAPLDSNTRIAALVTTSVGRLVWPADSIALANAIDVTLSQPHKTHLIAGEALEWARYEFSIANTWTAVRDSWVEAMNKGLAGGLFPVTRTDPSE